MRNWQNLTALFEEGEVNDEMRKKYQGSILGIRTPSNKTVYATYDRYREGFHVFRDREGGVLKLAPETECEVFIAFPEKGLYNTPTGMVYFRRLPYRQYRKGITEENSYLSDVLIDVLTGNRSGNAVMQRIKHVLECQYPPHIDAAIEMLTALPSVALDRSFGISLPYTEGETTPFVYFLNNVIGFIRGTDVVIKNPVFFQEAIDSRCFGHYRIVME